MKILDSSRPKNTIFIEGLVGLGSVAQIAAEALIKQKKAIKLAEFYSPYLGNIAITPEPGKIELPNYELYWFREDGQDYLVLFTRFWQPRDEKGNFLFNYEVFQFIAKLYKPSLVVTLGGLVTGQQQEVPLSQPGSEEQRQEEGTGSEPRRYYIFTNNEIQELVKQRLGTDELALAPQFLQVSGAAGLFQGFAKLLGIPGFCILVEVRDVVIDIYAAKYLILELSKALNLKVDLSEIEKRIEEQEEVLKEVKQKTEEILRKIQSKQTKYRI